MTLRTRVEYGNRHAVETKAQSRQKLHHTQHGRQHRIRHSGSLHQYATDAGSLFLPNDTSERLGDLATLRRTNSHLSRGMVSVLFELDESAGVFGNSMNDTADTARYANQAYSSALVILMAAIFVFITVTTTAFLSAFCWKRNSVFVLQKSQQEDLEDCEMEEFHTEEVAEQDLGGSDGSEVDDSKLPLCCSSSSAQLSRDRMYQTGHWTKFLRRSRSQLLMLFSRQNPTGVRQSRSETFRTSVYKQIQHSVSNWIQVSKNDLDRAELQEAFEYIVCTISLKRIPYKAVVSKSTVNRWCFFKVSCGSGLYSSWFLVSIRVNDGCFNGLYEIVSCKRDFILCW